MSRKVPRARRSRAGSSPRVMPAATAVRSCATVRRPAETCARARPGANTPTTGTPNAPAMCSGPESCPANSVASESAAAVLGERAVADLIDVVAARMRDAIDAARRARAVVPIHSTGMPRRVRARRRPASTRRAERSGRASWRTDGARRSAAAAASPSSRERRRVGAASSDSVVRASRCRAASSRRACSRSTGFCVSSAASTCVRNAALRWRARPMRTGMRAAATAAAVRHGASLRIATSYCRWRTSRDRAKNAQHRRPRDARADGAQNGSAAITVATCGMSARDGRRVCLAPDVDRRVGKRLVQRRRERRREHEIAEVVERDDQNVGECG